MKSKKRSKRPRVVKIYSDVYGLTVLFVVGPRPSQKELDAISRRHGVLNQDGTTPPAPQGTAGTYTRGRKCMVWLPAISMNPSHMESFMHEMVHVVTWLAGHTGQPVNSDTDEMHAYWAGWLVGELLKKYFK